MGRGAVNLHYEVLNTPGPYNTTISGMEMVPCCVLGKKKKTVIELPAAGVTGKIS